MVITTGSVQGSEGMYVWLAQDLAERGYVVLTYDVQGQGTARRCRTSRARGGNALPFCNPFAEPRDGEQYGCPGVPFQQLSNFVVGTEDAIDFFMSTPARPYANPGSAGATVTTPPTPTAAGSTGAATSTPRRPGARTKLAIIGHSMGAAAVSKVQGTDRRVAAVVALDKLAGPSSTGPLDGTDNKPVAPALAVQSEYGFTVSPYLTQRRQLARRPQPTPEGPDPMRERATGFDAWAKAGVDSMLVVPRASTHLEYTDIPLVLPGQPLRPGPHQRLRPALARPLPQAPGQRAAPAREAVPLPRAGRQRPVVAGDPEARRLLSFYYCSAYRLDARNGVRAGRRRHRGGLLATAATSGSR